jgi:hypothetical protein
MSVSIGILLQYIFLGEFAEYNSQKRSASWPTANQGLVYGSCSGVCGGKAIIVHLAGMLADMNDC